MQSIASSEVKKVLLLVTVALSMGAGKGSAQTYDQITEQLKTRLAHSGHIALEGKFQAFKKEDCDKIIPTFGNCFANNPAAPYVIATPPRVQGEYVDPYYGNFAGIIPEGLEGSYRVKETEALVVIGKMPPRAAYFGFQSYIFTRLNTSIVRRVIDDNFSSLMDKFYGSSPNPGRFYQFAAISDAFNERVLASNLAIPYAWNEQFAVITTANKNTADLLVSQLRASGMPMERIFIEKLPSQASLGLHRYADDLVSLIRYSLPEDLAAADLWLSKPTLRLLRVNPMGVSLSRYGTFQPLNRSAFDEMSLKEGLSEVAEAAQTRIKVPTSEPTSFLPISIIGIQGPTCIENKMNCLGDTFDTDTYRAGGLEPIPNDGVWIVVGVNHTVTGNATYISLGLNNQEVLKGISSVSQTGPAAGFISGDLTGSITRILAGDLTGLSDQTVANLNKYYVHIFARDCTDLPECSLVPPSLNDIDAAVILQRAYIKPGTSHGADPALMVSPVIMKGRK